MEHRSLRDIPYRDLDYWRGLCSGMTICGEQPIAEKSSLHNDRPIRKQDWDLCKQLVKEDGYFAYESFFPCEQIGRLAACFRRLDDEGIPPVLCFVYDEFWELLLQLHPLLLDLLGQYTLLPAVWAWIVTSTNQTAFAPHRDQKRETSLDNENHLDYLTLWIPLTDLNHLSSSIFVLPASHDANYDKNTSRTDVENLQDIRSLQVPKGSVLGWTVGLVHWGSRQSPHGAPRMSVGYYVQKSKAESLEGPPIELDVPFSLAQRLRLIGDQILMYSRDRNNELIRFAKDLAELDEM